VGLDSLTLPELTPAEEKTPRQCNVRLCGLGFTHNENQTNEETWTKLWCDPFDGLAVEGVEFTRRAVSFHWRSQSSSVQPQSSAVISARSSSESI
jgi:hypothetical protein